jgi:hypothetical protein
VQHGKVIRVAATLVFWTMAFESEFGKTDGFSTSPISWAHNLLDKNSFLVTGKAIRDL